jgi:hypothetical protein
MGSSRYQVYEDLAGLHGDAGARSGSIVDYSAESLQQLFASSGVNCRRGRRQSTSQGCEGQPQRHHFEHFVVVGAPVTPPTSGGSQGEAGDDGEPAELQQPWCAEVLYQYPAARPTALAAPDLAMFCQPPSRALPPQQQQLGAGAARVGTDAWHSWVAAPALEGAQSWLFSLQGEAAEATSGSGGGGGGGDGGGGHSGPLYGVCLSVVWPLDAPPTFAPRPASGAGGVAVAVGRQQRGLGWRCYCFLSFQPHLLRWLDSALRLIATHEKRRWLAGDQAPSTLGNPWEHAYATELCHRRQQQQQQQQQPPAPPPQSQQDRPRGAGGSGGGGGLSASATAELLW